MSNTYKDLQNSHPCFGGHRNNVGRIHLPVSPGCNIACRFCDRVIMVIRANILSLIAYI